MPLPLSRSRQNVLTLVLITTMIASTFQMFALGVLAAPMLEDLGISRWALGLAGAINTLVGSLTAPITGRITDRIGARRSVVMIGLLASCGMTLMALSSSLWTLAGASVASGIPQGWGNPATNALIGQSIAPGQRGTITGIKQSGVTLALFLSGATLPLLTQRSSWQGAAGVFAGVFALFAVFSFVATSGSSNLSQTSPQSRSLAAGPKDPVPTYIWQMAIFALLMGTSSGAIGRFLPLFAEEVLGMGRTPAGMLIAVVGIGGIIFRIGVARLAEHRVAPRRLLLVLSVTAVGTSFLLLAAHSVGSWLLWPIAILYAFGHIAWNAVVNLAIITSVRNADAGRFSGIVMLGFLFGLTIGTPITGWVVDTFDSYQPVWIGAATLAAVAAAVISRPPPDDAERLPAQGLPQQ